MFNPFSWFFWNPSAEKQAQRDLNKAKLSLLDAAYHAEYYKGLSNTLKATIKRLEKSV